MNIDDCFQIPSAQQMVNGARREGYYEEMFKFLQEERDHIARENGELRRRVGEAVKDAEGWRALAIKFGSDVEQTWKKSTGTLEGRVSIAQDLLYPRSERANFVITDLCQKLARQLMEKT